MPAVFRQKDPIIVVDQDWTERVKDAARAEPLRRARLNLHHSESDQIQEMLIAFCRDSLTAPHRHLGKSESFHMVEGRLDLVFFDDAGTVIRRLRLGGPGTGLPSLYRLNAPDWHIVIPLDEMVVVHETGVGPFVRDTEQTPEWVPKDQEGLAAFIDGLRSPDVAVLATGVLDDAIRHAICALKATHWPYPLDSQLAWFAQHVGAEDRHALLWAAGALAGYIRLVRGSGIVDGQPARICGLSSVVVAPALRGKGFGEQLVRATMAGFDPGATGLLQCTHALADWYGRAGWRPFTGRVTCQGGPFLRDEFVMVHGPAATEIIFNGESF